MKRILIFFAVISVFVPLAAQQYFSGQVFMRDNSSLYLNQMYVTNLNQMKTVLTDYNGAFRISAKPGDIIRFTSIITDRKDITVSQQQLEAPNNLVEAKIAYYDIEEVVLPNFKPSGNLRKDVLALKTKDKGAGDIQKMIGLPRPKGNGLPPDIPAAAFANGGLSFNLNTIYDILSGEKKKKERLYAFERMNSSISSIKKYFGEDYFVKLNIPKNLIDNFLQFVYSSDNLAPRIQSGNYEAAAPSIEKYLPIYLKRLRNSNLASVAG